MQKRNQDMACCPKCESKELMAFEGDRFCLECSWDSLQMSVERGDLDDAIYDYEEKLTKAARAQVAAADASKKFDGSAA